MGYVLKTNGSKLLTALRIFIAVLFLFAGFCAKGADSDIVRKPVSSFVLAGVHWDIVSYQLKEPDYGIVPAKLCFKQKGEKQCELIEKKYGVSKYPFQEIIHVESIPNKIGFDGVLVVSQHTGTVSRLRAIDIWKFTPSQHAFVNLVSSCVIEGESEYRLIFQNGSAFLITAQRRWEKGESLDDPHRYHVVVNKIASFGSTVVSNFVTKNKFGGEDVNIDVIDAVLPEIYEKTIELTGRN